MSTCTHKSMINHHGQPALLRPRLSETLHVWRQRYEAAPRTRPVDRTRPARHRHVLERCCATKPANPSGGLELHAIAGAASIRGAPAHSFGVDESRAMTSLRLDDLKQYSDVLRSRSGEPVTVRFVEPRDAEALQNYFRSLTTRSRYNRFLGAMQRTAEEPARQFHPCRRGRAVHRPRDHDGRRL